MGNTAEAVANQFKVSREDQDEFAYNSHMKALEALKNDKFKDQIAPYQWNKLSLTKTKESN